MSVREISLPSARVHVWLVRIDCARDLDAPCGLLDDRERSVLRRLRVAEDRRSYVVSHLLLRLALSRATAGAVPPARWRFEQSAGGGPSVDSDAGLPRLDFSLSRSSGLAVVAVANTVGCRVGVDAERSDRALCCIPDDVALSPAERSHLARYPAARQPAEFLKLWTLKEAYGKLRGCGVCLPLERIEVATSPARLVRTEEGLPPPKELHLESRQIRTDDGVYCVSLAIQSGPNAPPPRVAFRLLDTLRPDTGDEMRLPDDEGAVECCTEGEAI
jgi:4'-phosphopantetheinyl transferase